MESGVVTIKVSKEAHKELKNLRHVFFVDTYPEVIDKLLEERRQKEISV
jgi:predicted CopG family antitoxin